MSRTEFDEIFSRFKEKFPPAESLSASTLQLSTADIVTMITDFFPDLELPRIGITRYMIGEGYLYEPVEYNEQIRYRWLVRESC